MKHTTLIITFLLYGASVYAQWSSDMAQDRSILSSFFSRVKAVENASMGEQIIQSALYFLDTPYVGHTLEIGEEEQLIINLRELDCTTFMENCIALSRAIQMKTPHFDAYCKILEYMRYRNGKVDGYVSRLHYTTDWIADNVAKGVLEDITRQAGGKPLHLQLSFMSSNPDSYKHLKERPDRVERIRQIEEQINKRGNYYYIPKEEIPIHQKQIKSGDIIGFTTSIKGLDISHVAIAYWQGDVLTFIHASSTAKKVIVEPDSLLDYCNKVKSNTGIVVLRCRPVVPAAQ